MMPKFLEKFFNHYYSLLFSGTPTHKTESGEPIYYRDKTIEYLKRIFSNNFFEFTSKIKMKLRELISLKEGVLNKIASNTDSTSLILLSHYLANRQEKAMGTGKLYLSKEIGITHTELLNAYRNKHVKVNIEKPGAELDDVIYYHPCDKTFMSNFMRGWEKDLFLQKRKPPIIVTECENGTQSFVATDNSGPRYGSYGLEHFLNAKTIGELVDRNNYRLKVALKYSKMCVHVPYQKVDGTWCYIQIF
jgi:hypothetical protein